MDPKKRREEEALRRVYSPEYSWEEDERPDFRVRTPAGTVFGVEVTDVFLDETDARLKMMPGYVHALLGGAPFRHRDDPTNVIVGTGHVQSPEDPAPRPVQMIQRTLPAVDAWAALVEERVREKNRKAEQYARDLTHWNLLVNDRTGRLTGVTAERAYAHIAIPTLRDALRRSPFREVLFLTSIGKGLEHCLPLRRLTLLGDIYGAVRAYGGLEGAPVLADVSAGIEHLVALLRRLGWDVCFDSGREGMDVVADCAAVRFRGEPGIVLLDHLDFDVQPRGRLPEDEYMTLVPDALFAQLRDEMDDLAFDCELSWRVLGHEDAHQTE